VLGQGLAVLLDELRQLPRPVPAFEQQIAVVEATQDLPRLQQVARTDVRLGDVAVEPGDDGPLDPALESRVGREKIGA